MPLPALLLTIAVLLPLASFVVLVFIGKRMGNPLAGWFGTIAIGASFVCSIAAMVSWLSRPDTSSWGYNIAPINVPYAWVPTGQGLAQHTSGFLDIGVYVDSVTILMFAMITGIATLVHLFSIGYMHEDKRFPRFFTYLGLFCFSMLGLVLGGTALQLFIFWELVGLCSYLLIGFWYEKKSASNAAIKAFVTNRVGDFGFLIGFGILMGVELILNAANVNLVAFNRYSHGGSPGSPVLAGQVFAIFVIVLAAAEAAVALAIFLNFYNNFSTIDVERAQNLKG
jgi:NADH:ubiquinone oxidoreductase subunit 5 (subunit L)/multisubunit Na+/H+ antiporter MnhA subunit